MAFVTTYSSFTIAGVIGSSVQFVAGKFVADSSVKPTAFVGHKRTRLPLDLAIDSSGIGSVKITDSVSVAVLPAASEAVTSMTLRPGCKGMSFTLHGATPLATPCPPRLLVHFTSVTPTLSAAVPERSSVLNPVSKTALRVGKLMLMLGALVSGGAKKINAVSAAMLPLESVAVT
jgi:hypothetical protein